jgi:hypothetical protein
VKPASDALEAFLASPAAKTMVMADVITFYLSGGIDETFRLRWTTAQTDISEYPLDGDVIRRTWTARDVIITGLRAKASIGTNVDEQDLTFNFAPATLIRGVPATQAILQGMLDGAQVRRDRFYYGDWAQATQGGMPKFYGLVGPFTAAGRMDVTVKCKSMMGLLSQMMPRHLAKPGCANTVYDPGCGLDFDAHAVHTTVGAGATPSSIPLAAASPDYAASRAFFEDEGLAGLWRGVKSSDGVGITLYEPLPSAPVAGTHVTVWPGCDRTKLGGCTRLGNTGRFRGFEHVPQAQTAL